MIFPKEAWWRPWWWEINHEPSAPGAPVHSLGVAPHQPQFHGSLKVRAREMESPSHPGALV